MRDKKKIKLCCVFNYNPLYRLPIFKKIDETFDTNFFFGDTVFEPIKQFDSKELDGFIKYIKAKKLFKGYVWHSGIKQIFNKRYTHFILTGSPSYLINWLILLYAILFRKKVYLWCHGITRKISSPISRFYCKVFYNSASGILLYGNYSKPFMIDLGIKADKLSVIHNSLNTELQTKIYNNLTSSDIYEKHFKNFYPAIIYIGRIQKRKKIEQIIEALLLLKQKGKLINLVVVGGITNDFGLSDIITKYDLNSQVWMYGACYDEDKNAELIYNAKACVSPGNVGLTCMHTLSYGTPMISNNNFSTQMPEFEAIIDGETGTFFEENNIESLAEAIEYWVSIPEDERELTRSKCRNVILKDWSTDYQIKVLKSVL